MSLTSQQFFLFLIALGIVYFLVPKKTQWVFLLIGSYVFYLSADVRLVGYILFSTLTSFFGGLLIEKQSEKAAMGKDSGGDGEAQKKRAQRIKKQILVAVLLLNFSILAWFKHLDAWISYLNGIFGVAGLSFSIEKVDLILPLGISFYTFQSMGYLIDVYRTKIRADRNVAKFALFVSFFPQLIQGPISRYDELAHQFFVPHRVSYTRIKHGVLLMLWGLFKKLVIADRVAMVITGILNMNGHIGINHHPYGLYVVLLGIFYSIQIYADFSGGVDIARGAAQILGIDLPQNFMRPYFSKTLPDYWRRWHVTLNNWWRDYIFYPLVFSALFTRIARYFRKKKKLKTAKMLPIYVGTMVVRVVNALWHGASVKYLANGFYNGILIILGMQFNPFFMKLAKLLRVNTEAMSFQLFRILRTFMLASVARLVTIAPRFRVSILLLSGAAHRVRDFSFDTLFQITFPPRVWFVLVFAIAVWITADILNEKGIVVRELLEKQNILFQWIMILALIVSIVAFGVYGTAVDSGRFIYQQF